MKTIVAFFALSVSVASSFAQIKTALPAKDVQQPVLTITPVTPTVMKDTEFPNWDFEQGLTGWTKAGTAFNNQPVFGDNIVTTRVLYQMEFNSGGVGGDYWKDQGYDVGRNGRFWIGTYENSQPKTFFQTQGDQPLGTLTSSAFLVTTNYCYFSIGGGADQQRLWVGLEVQLPDGTWALADKRTSFRNSEIMYRERMDIGVHKNKVARITIVDDSYAGWGHINVDNIRFSDTPLDAIVLTDPSGRRYEVDVNTPVWGIADTHAHPAHEVGFGKYLITGNASAPLTETYSHDLCVHNHNILGVGPVQKPFILGVDDHGSGGWPDFIDFPTFHSKTHQQQHVEFLKRAFDGGMRLVCALAINNMYVPSLFLGPGNDGTAFDDETALMQQIEEIKRMVAKNPSWMEIALSPRDARRIILQGKMAIVLGLEADNLGNFKSESYNWVDKNPGALANNPLVTLNEGNADQMLDAKLTDYRFKGIRQITPIHYISGVFGGAALFRSELAVLQTAFNNDVNVKSGVDKRIPFSLYSDYVGVLKFSNPPVVTKEGYTGLIKSFYNEPTRLSTINTLGLTNIGNKLIQKMMVNAFIIDSEHMSYESKDNVFSFAAARNYPVISSHTDPASLSMNWTGAPTEFKDGDVDADLRANLQNFGTTNIRNLANEFETADEHFAKISSSGGTVGVFMLPYYKKPYSGYLGSVPNDCAGSTKTFAQMYLYSLEKMNLRGVALATDRGMTDFIGPRFGPNSAYGLKDEKLDSEKIDRRKTQRLAQQNGVRYDVPMRSYHHTWYEAMETQGVKNVFEKVIVPYEEEDMWKALAAFEAGVGLDNVPASREITHLRRIKNFYEGLTITTIGGPGLEGQNYFERAAMFCANSGMNVTALPGFDGWFAADKEYTMLLHNAIVPVLRSWKLKNGSNLPLRRFKTGNRYWDFNTDGMAHYGMMPDFLQDLRNIGITPANLTPLFRSAEDYIQMWEKAEKFSGTSPQPGVGPTLPTKKVIDKTRTLKTPIGQ